MITKGIAAWPLDDLNRVFANDRPPKNAKALRRRGWNLCAARGEYCVFQVGIRTNVSLNEIEVSPGELLKGRDSISADNLRVRWTGLVPVPATLGNLSGAERKDLIPGWYPDPLLEKPKGPLWTATPMVPCTTSACMIMKVPYATKAGRYRGKVAIIHKGVKLANIPVSLEVWPFEMPRKPGFHVTNWFQPDCVTKWHRCEPWSERHWRLLELYAKTMSEYRQDTITTPTIIGNFHNSDPMVLVDTIRTKGGGYRFDFKKLERWVELFDKYGFEYFEMWHLASQGNGKLAPPFPIDDEKKGRRIMVEKLPVLGKEYRKLAGTFLQELSQWLERRGLSERFLLHVYDEPRQDTWEHYSKLSDFFRKHAPKLKHIDAISKSSLITEFGADIDIPVPLTRHLNDEDGYYRRRGQEGKEQLWWYTCCGPGHPFANRFVSMPLINTRILSWQAFAYGIGGYLHWGYNFWHRVGQDASGLPGINVYADHTLVNPYCESPLRWPTGDSCIVYPHPNWWEEHGPVSSLRYEAHRAGLQDYELLHMLRGVAEKPGNSVIGSKAKKLLSAIRGPIAGSLTRFSRNSRRLLDLRREIGKCIEANHLHCCPVKKQATCI